MPNTFYAGSIDELSTRDELLSMSGLDFMRGMLAGTIAHPPIARVLNYRVSRVEAGLVAFRGTPLFDALNPMRGVHGGWYGTILDSCLACAVMTTLPVGGWYTTLEYKINITRAIPEGMEVEATGEIQHAGRSTGIARAEMRGVDDGKLYATGSTTCMIFQS